MTNNEEKVKCFHLLSGCKDCLEFADFAQKENERLREGLEKIEKQSMPELSDDVIERSMQLAGLWVSLKMIAKETLR